MSNGQCILVQMDCQLYACGEDFMTMPQAPRCSVQWQAPADTLPVTSLTNDIVHLERR